MSAESTLRAWANDALALVAPHVCLACRQQGGAPLCPACVERLPWMDEHVCTACGRPIPPGALLEPKCAECRRSPAVFDLNRSVFTYDEPLSDVILRFKFARRHDLGQWLGSHMADYIRKNPDFREAAEAADFVVPVPLHWTRYMKRPYNQVTLLARHVVRELDRPMAHVLKRSGKRMPQSRLRSAAERRKNIRGAFKVRDPRRVEGATVLLVDDVITTGSTCNECARVLKKAGAERVLCFTLSRRVLFE